MYKNRWYFDTHENLTRSSVFCRKRLLNKHFPYPDTESKETKGQAAACTSLTTAQVRTDTTHYTMLLHYNSSECRLVADFLATEWLNTNRHYRLLLVVLIKLILLLPIRIKIGNYRASL